jgi:hypothetical protein
MNRECSVTRHAMTRDDLFPHCDSQPPSRHVHAMATQPIMEGVEMSKLDQQDADRIITSAEFTQLKSEGTDGKALRCNVGRTYSAGDGYNLDPYNYLNSVDYATAVYASVCFSQDTIHSGIDNYFFLLMSNCALGSGESYNYVQGSLVYATLPKCHGLGGAAQVNANTGANGSAIAIARWVVEQLL